MRFRGQLIFGSQVQQTGPIPKMRFQREQLPGVRGYRVYQLIGAGPDTYTWTLRGRLVATTLDRLQASIVNSQDWIGTFGLFEETGGAEWDNCELVDYRPTSGFKRCIIDGITYFTCEVSGTVEYAGG
jgi:hypothetical protein